MKKKQVFLLSATLIFLLQPLFLTAEGITILRQNMRTVLLVESEGHSENTGVELKIIGDGIINLVDKQETRSFRFSTGQTAETVYLYTDLTGIFPEKIYISAAGSGFDLLSAKLTEPASADKVRPADIGHIIFSEFIPGESGMWNVYEWNLIPQVLIFDTADYETQARIFKRLAFFVEKPGYTGRLVENAELEGKHGWNAHDYKPSDLADFFTLAEETGFTLNKEELELKQLLLDHGIIQGDAGSTSFSAGKGAVLSVSRETLPNWRYRFLTHECLHGLFFTDENYRKEITEAFYNLEEEEIEFWKHLLDYRQYDVDNEYLLVNEFMAYSLQQPLDEVDEYFKGFLYTRMIAARPWEKVFVENFDRRYTTSFTSAVLRLEKILYTYTGRASGHLANLYPAELNESFFDLFPPI